MVSAPSSQTDPPPARQAPRLPTSERIRENITGWLFISPAILLISVFGLFPILFAVYMSMHKWRLSKGDFYCKPDGVFSALGCLENYTEIVGDWGGAGMFLLGLLLLIGAYWLWAGDKHYFSTSLNKLPLRDMLVRVVVPILLLLASYLFYANGTVAMGEAGSTEESRAEAQEIFDGTRYEDFEKAALQASSQSPLVLEIFRRCTRIDDATTDSILACLNEADSQVQRDGVAQLIGIFPALAVALWILVGAHRSGIAKLPRDQELMDTIARLVPAFLIAGVGSYYVAKGYGLMLAQGNEEFVRGLSITLYYAIGSVPIQLGLGLSLAYVLYQKLIGREFFRMLFFLPYVTPAVASAVVFRIVFNPREGLMNNIMGLFGRGQLPWINGSAPFLNDFFGFNLEGFLAGPSSAMVSVIILGIWTYTGYNVIIFLAGLGQIPEDLYEAAKVDGASDWHLFRYITLPLLSPITFYLSVLAFIGTFKAFNHIFVMRTPFAQGTVDTASLIIFDTFKQDFQYGIATAEAILLFLVILGLTQVQRTFFERKVFYG